MQIVLGFCVIILEGELPDSPSLIQQDKLLVPAELHQIELIIVYIL